MGHISDVKQSYKKLRGRLDKYPVGAPESKEGKMGSVLDIFWNGSISYRNGITIK